MFCFSFVETRSLFLLLGLRSDFLWCTIFGIRGRRRCCARRPTAPGTPAAADDPRTRARPSAGSKQRGAAGRGAHICRHELTWPTGVSAASSPSIRSSRAIAAALRLAHVHMSRSKLALQDELKYGVVRFLALSSFSSPKQNTTSTNTWTGLIQVRSLFLGKKQPRY
jgi:hypothetical protein